MSGAPDLQSIARADRLELVAAGPWTADYAGKLEPLVDKVARVGGTIRQVAIDMKQVDRLDTFGAWLIERTERVFAARGCEITFVGLKDTYLRLIEEMRQVNRERARAPRHPPGILRALDLVGRAMYDMWISVFVLVAMLGTVTAAGLGILLRPHQFRMTSTVYHLERVGWRAVPIVLLITFLIGAIIAQQGIFHFRKFGADVFVVDMIGILVLREIGVLIVCIMVAGRSGSAYTAELGTMKMREEIDALHTMGLNSTEVLILPRIIALLIAVPILTFIGSMSALYGGGLVSWLYGGIDPDAFLARLRDAIDVDHFIVGMLKAPFMALTIGVVACAEGLQVRGSAQSLGQQTTTSVVKSIFLVIVLDGLFAMFFAAIGI